MNEILMVLKPHDYKAAIFDFNGTVFWDTAFHDRAFDIFLQKHGVQLTDKEKRVKIHGKANADIMRGIFGNHLTHEEIHAMSLEKELLYQNLCLNDLHFAPGSEALFDYLHNVGIPMTIATSSGVENVDFYFKYMNLGRWFSKDKVAYSYGNLRGKPFPDLFLEAAAKLDLPLRETVIFEDSVAGIVAAESAGAGKIYIVNSYNENYSRFSHDIITHFDQVDRKLFGK